MKTRWLSFGLVASFSALAVACGETPPPDVAPQPAAVPQAVQTSSAESISSATSSAPSATTSATASAAPVAAPAPAKKTAKELIEAGGTFAFSLADSADAKKAADESCSKKAKKDEKKLAACKDDAAKAASGEGIRFEKDKDGKWWWVSFGAEKGKEVAYLKVMFKITSSEGDKVVVAPDGKLEGTMAKKLGKDAPKEMSFTFSDETTVTMADPKKGTLVYKKK